MIKDFKYIIKRILIGLGIILVLSFIRSCEVHAKEYQIVQDIKVSNSIAYFQPSYNSISYNYNSLKFADSSLGNLYQFRNNYWVDYLNLKNGQYLQTFTYYGVGIFSSQSCQRMITHFYIKNENNGQYSEMNSQCIDTFSTTVGDYVGQTFLYSFNVTNNPNNIPNGDIYMTMQDTYYAIMSPISSGMNFGMIPSAVMDYSPEIINSFKSLANQKAIENKISQSIETQHQDSINEQNAINGITDSINDSSIPSDSSNQINAITSAINNNQNSSIVQIATFIPQTLQVILNGFQANCTGGYSLGSLYGTELTIPCINPVDYLGSFLWGVIDSILCLCYLIPLCKFLVNKYNDLTSLKNLRWQ